MSEQAFSLSTHLYRSISFLTPGYFNSSAFDLCAFIEVFLRQVNPDKFKVLAEPTARNWRTARPAAGRRAKGRLSGRGLVKKSVDPAFNAPVCRHNDLLSAPIIDGKYVRIMTEP